MSKMQRTLKYPVHFEGIGLHSGSVVNVEIRPAPANTGILFHRSDLPGSPYIKASAENVLDTTLATRLGTADASISTVEHLMAAFYGFGIDNAVVSLNSFELPILDGSAIPFLVLLDEAGVQELKVPRKLMIIKKMVEVVDPRNPERFVRIEPSKETKLSYSINFERAQAIGRQTIHVNLSGREFCKMLCYARTFCLSEDVEFMRSRGLARGGSMENAIVVDRTAGVQNARGLRIADEFVRHKALDCVGDLMLVGMPLVGHIIANKAGHDLHTTLAQKLLATASEQQVVTSSAKEAAKVLSLLDFPQSTLELADALALSLVRG